MWKIGNVNINSRVVLAPMAGITSFAYRNFMKQFGVGLSVTEMISDCGLIYGNEKTIDYLKTSEDEQPVAVQLFGSDSKNICKAIDIVLEKNPNIKIIDINLGCPVPKVTKTGAGSSLLRDSVKLGKFMAEICQHSPVPITAKIRLGWDNNTINFLENIKVLEKAGVKAIAIHARTTAQGYSGKANYEIIRNLKEKMNVPLIISGDIFTLDDAINALKITGADAVMVARGAVGNPYLVHQINSYLNDAKIEENVSLDTNIKYLITFMDMLILEKGELQAMSILRGIAPKFLNNYPGTKKLKNIICQTITTRDSLMRILESIDK